MWKTKERLSRPRGFSLVELIIVSSLLAVVSLAVFSVFSAGLKIYQRAQSYEGRKANILIFLEKMERDLRNTFDCSAINFVGDPEKISFPGMVKKVDAAGVESLSVSRITYYFDASKEALLKEETAFSNTNAEKSYGPGITAAGEGFSASGVNFSYCYFEADAKSYSWKDSADGGMAPAAVKIEALFKDGDKDVRLVRTVLIPVSG